MLRRWLVHWSTLGIKLGLLLLLAATICGDNVGAACLVIIVICEDVVLLSIDNGLNKLSRFVALLLEDFNDDVHDVWSDGWASSEYSLDNLSSELLKLEIYVLDQLHCWLTNLVKLRLQEIDQQVH